MDNRSGSGAIESPSRTTAKRADFLQLSNGAGDNFDAAACFCLRKHQLDDRHFDGWRLDGQLQGEAVGRDGLVAVTAGL